MHLIPDYVLHEFALIHVVCGGGGEEQLREWTNSPSARCQSSEMKTSPVGAASLAEAAGDISTD